ncbi:MAG: acyltransferase family protein [Promethearchaeota archaeon]|jgi:hypothetical protein
MTEEKWPSELGLTNTDEVKEVTDRGKYFQIDVLKAVMIFLVIFDHMVSWGIKRDIGVTLWERISIPVFLVIMGFNMGKSFQQKGYISLREFYSWSYFKGKIKRFIVPFLILYGFSTLIGSVLYQFNIITMYQVQYSPQHGFIQLFTVILPFWGPGNWFIPVIFGFIIVFPLIYWAFTKKPKLTLILCFSVEIAMQLIVFFSIGDLYPGGVLSWPKVYLLNLFMTNILFYLSAIGLGVWFSFGHNIQSNRNFFMWFIYPISLAFITAYQFFGFRIIIGNVLLFKGDYLFLIFPYSAMIFLLVMRIIPQISDNWFSKGISLIGKSTYHILLTQILGYGMIYALRGTHYLIRVGFSFLDVLYLIAAWVIFISFGVLWYKIDKENSLTRRLLYYFNFFLVFSIVVFYFFVSLPVFEWVPIPFVIILIYGVSSLLVNFALKKPIKLTTLALWTLFLVFNYFITILYLGIIPPTEYLIQNISIVTFLVFVIIGTVLNYKIVR